MTRTLLAMILVLSQSGCALQSWMAHRDPFRDGAPCQIPPNITKEQLVAHLNKNIQGSAMTSGLASWRSMNAKITATGMPPGISVPATIAVEAPRNLRLRISEPLTRTEVLDMGSNAEHFWFWAKDAQPQQVITISHDDMPAAQRDLRVPFHPDWLMEVLGVIPIDGSKFTLQHGRADAPTLELISENISSAGEPTRSVIRVDACHGIIREHALYDSRGILIARAAIADHRIDPTTGLVVPHLVNFDWPAMQQSMRLTLGTVELNPPQMPPAVWQIPVKPGAPRVDLAQILRARASGHPSMYGANSPFGIMPPPESLPLDPAGTTDVGNRPPVAQTTYESVPRWDQDAESEGHDADSAPGVARVYQTHPEVTPESASEPPSAYSPEAAQSSSDRPHRARALWRWPSD